MFDSFKSEYGKAYSTMGEESDRYAIFVNNLKVIDERNAEEKRVGGSAIHGITKYMDLTQEEFSSRYLKSKPSMRSSTHKFVEVPRYTGVSASVDWSGKLTTPVKDQGYCGSCWAFSATEQIESDAIRTLGSTFILSPEQITQCDATSYGCDGGWTENAFDYVHRTGGIETDQDYPYTSSSGVTGKCHSESNKYKVGVTTYHTINGETNMANYVLATGPLSVCVDAASWSSYRGGIMTSCGKRVDHCVQAVGVDTGANGYWKVRNSWGTSWGESGYIRLAYGQDTCAITSDPNYADVYLD